MPDKQRILDLIAKLTDEHGVEWPDWTAFVTVGPTGAVTAWSERPRPAMQQNAWKVDAYGARHERVNMLDISEVPEFFRAFGGKWKDCVIEYAVGPDLDAIEAEQRAIMQALVRVARLFPKRVPDCWL